MPHNTGILHDVTNIPQPLAAAYSLNGTTYLDTRQTDTSLTATRGYDDQTGLGPQRHHLRRRPGNTPLKEYGCSPNLSRPWE